MNITKYKNPDDVRDWSEFFVELDAMEIQILCNLIDSHLVDPERLQEDDSLIKSLKDKLSNFDNHHNQDDTSIQYFTG